jgi:uncharacterized membrane protein YkvA (DUF1232 family)
VTPTLSDAVFWSKAKGAFERAGREVLEKALWLYFVLQKPDVPAWAKATIVGALVYFVAPLDAIPDLLPGVGYVDDAGALAAAVVAVAMHIDAGVKAKANETLQGWGLSA